MTRYLVTGGAGFIGSNFVRYLMRRDPEAVVTVLDKLTYAGNRENLRGLEGPRFRFALGDIADSSVAVPLVGQADVIVNFAAETHVDRSIVDPTAFLQTNVIGTQVLLETARKAKVARFLQVSTDEVYGSIERGAWTEETPLHPNSPYAASKAGADLLALAYATTYGVPVLITRSSNTYGPYQYPEKFIPLAITNLLEGDAIPLYGDGLNIRDWLYVEDHCEGIDVVLQRGTPGEVYHIGAGEGRMNLDVARAIVTALGKPSSAIQPVPDRPGHDRRYALDCRKLRALGWAPRRTLAQGLKATITWYQLHEAWWRPLKRCAAPHWLTAVSEPS